MRAELQLNQNDKSQGAAVCPRCGVETLHQGRVTIFNRKEDAASCFKATIEHDVVNVEASAAQQGNPSARRQGLTIDFECEGCGEGLQLCIAQHKGSTLIEWRYDG